MTKDIKEYVKDCDMCQRIKTSRHRFYDEFSSLSVSTRSWTKISMNFITKFFSNYYNDDIYDAILIIIDRFSKMTHYIFAKSMWLIENLIDVLFDKILLIFFEIKKIVFNREMMFTNDYWLALCYCIRVIRKLNIVFIRKLTIKSKNIIKHWNIVCAVTTIISKTIKERCFS